MIDERLRQAAREEYEKRISDLAQEQDFASLKDHPFLFASRQSVAAGLARIKLFEKILDVKGSVVECGVHKGNSILLFHHLSAIMEPYAFNRKLIGFDTFEGFSSVSEKDNETFENGYMGDSNYELIKSLAEIHDTNRPVGHIEKVDLVKGDAVQTIPKYADDHPELLIALLYLDFDIYKPTITALDYLLPRVVKGGIVAFDELNSQKWKGETEAFREKLGANNVRLKKFPFEPWMSYFVVE